MSRSRVKRGVAWTTTATPPITTKSTPARTRAPISTVGRKSGQFATVHLAGGCELASLLIHRFQAAQPLYRRQFELLANEAFVDAGSSRSRRDHELDPGCTQGAVERCEAWVRVGPLELSHSCLADRESLREIDLGHPCAPSRVGEQPPGERRASRGQMRAG